MFSCSTQQPQHFSHSICEEIYPLLKFSGWHVVRGHCFLHCLFSIRVSNVIIIFFFLSSYTHNSERFLGIHHDALRHPDLEREGLPAPIY